MLNMPWQFLNNVIIYKPKAPLRQAKVTLTDFGYSERCAVVIIIFVYLLQYCFNSLITMNILCIQKTVKLVRTIECVHATMVLYKYLKSLKHDDHILYMENSIYTIFIGNKAKTILIRSR
jgi:hypothetical protein